MKKEAFFIDTCVIMYARGHKHRYKLACARILLKVADGSFERDFGVPVVDTELFQEILYRYGMENRWETGIAVCRDLSEIGLNVLPVGWDEVQEMLRLAEKYAGKGVRPRDLVHAAVMLSKGVSKIITADTHFDLIEGVERIDPLSFPIEE